MELRSKVKNLRELLICAGVYEEGMEVEEMRQVAQAIELSSSPYNDIENSNIERALMESEIDFEMMLNSTMIVQPTTLSPPNDVIFDGAEDGAGIERECDSPCSNPVHMQVNAVVHHEQNWSPTSASCPIREKACENDHNLKRTTNRVAMDEGSLDPNANPSNPLQIQIAAEVQHDPNWSPTSAACFKRPISRAAVVEDSFDPDATPISIANSDSGVSCEVTGTLSSISEVSSQPSIGEVPSRLMISTSSAAVSDQSEREEHDLEFEDEDEVSH